MTVFRVVAELQAPTHENQTVFAGDLYAHSGYYKAVALVRGNTARKELALNAIAVSTLASRGLLLKTTTCVGTYMTRFKDY